MKHIKLFENFNYELIKEDVLELKQMSKQMYSFFKSKGFPVEIEEKISDQKLKELADKGMVKSGLSVDCLLVLIKRMLISGKVVIENNQQLIKSQLVSLVLFL